MQKKDLFSQVGEPLEQSKEKRVERKVLDERYLLVKTIGHGRYAK